MNRLRKRIYNKLRRVWVWSGFFKIKDFSNVDDNLEMDETSKMIIKIFKTSLKNQDSQLLKVVIDNDVYYEVHDHSSKIYLSILKKTNGCLAQILEFPKRDRKLNELTSILPTSVADRLVQSFQHEANQRSQRVREEFDKFKKTELDKIYNELKGGENA